MSIINDEHGFVFLHVAKTGGRSINLSLKKRYGKHGQFKTKSIDPDENRLGRLLGMEARELAGEQKWNDYFTFAFVRHPCDRLVSIYENIRTDYRKNMTPAVKSASLKGIYLSTILDRLNISFEDFTFERFVYDVLRDRVFENYHWDSQSNAVTNGKGTVIFDFLGRFERLQADFDLACKKAGLNPYQLPHFNKSERDEWPRYFDDALLKEVYNLYREDFEILEYNVSTCP